MVEWNIGISNLMLKTLILSTVEHMHMPFIHHLDCQQYMNLRNMLSHACMHAYQYGPVDHQKQICTRYRYSSNIIKLARVCLCVVMGQVATYNNDGMGAA